MKKLALFIIAILTITGCQKDNSLSEDANKITIKDVKPIQNSVYQSGDTVSLEAHIATGSELHSASFLVKTAGGDTLYNAYKHAHTNNLSLSYKWLNSVTQATTLQVEILVILGNGHSDSLLIPIQCKP